MERTLSKGSGETNTWKEHYPTEVGILTCGKNIIQRKWGYYCVVRTLSKGSGDTNVWKEHYPKEVGKLTCGKIIIQ